MAQRLRAILMTTRTRKIGAEKKLNAKKIIPTSILFLYFAYIHMS